MKLKIKKLIPIFLLVAVNCFAGETPPAAAIASAQPLATAAGMEILNKGGNAFDAAVAVTAALAVVEPMGSGLGGGGFWLLHRESDGLDIMLDGREKAPGAAHPRMYLNDDDEVNKGVSLNGPMAAGIPGVPMAMVYLAENYGRLPLAESLKPAIRYAEKGFEVTPRYYGMISFRWNVISRYPAAAAIFGQDGHVPDLGHKIVQKDLAKALRLLAKQGADGFYTGRFAQKLVQGVQSAGGIWTLEDLAGYNVVERPPIVFQYHDMKITSASPPSSGGVVLGEMLSILQHFDINDMDEAARDHYIVEAMRRAYRDRAVFLGDPDFVDVPVNRLLQPDYIAGLALTIDPDRATPSSELSDTPNLDETGNSTTHFSIIDMEGNRVAATLSVNLPFGSGFVAPGTGVLLNDEMDDFSIKPHTPNAYGLVGDHANAIAPGKRPLSSMSPTFVETADRVGILGTPGGSRIITMVLLGILDFEKGHLPASWVSRPRFHHQYLPDQIEYEQNGLHYTVMQGLMKRGHHLAIAPRGRYGNMQAVLWDKKNQRVYAASDPRGEGEALVNTISRKRP